MFTNEHTPDIDAAADIIAKSKNRVEITCPDDYDPIMFAKAIRHRLMSRKLTAKFSIAIERGKVNILHVSRRDEQDFHRFLHRYDPLT